MKKAIILSLVMILGLSFILINPIRAEEGETEVTPVTTSVQVEARSTDNNSILNRELVGNREKILAPEFIKDFEDIVRHGNSLYGVRKASSTPQAANISEAAKNMVRQLEKIAAPWLITQYEQIRKVGTALWGLKKDSPADNSNRPSNESGNLEPEAPAQSMYVKAENVACVISAIKAKDTALLAHNASTTSALDAAITARTTCQETALNLALNAASTTPMETVMQQQRNEMSLCLQAFKEKQVMIRTAGTEGHGAIWTNYKEALRLCQPSSDTSNPLMIEDGGGNIF